MGWVLALLLGWLVGRGLVVTLLLGPYHWVTGDVAYFVRSLDALPVQGLAGTLVEYPLPGLVLLTVPWLVDAGHAALVVLVLALLTDALFTALLLRSAAPGRPLGLAVWLLAVPLLGATTFARFDLVPGVLAGAALLVAAHRPAVAASVAALGAAVKLWPALLMPGLAALAPAPAARRRVLGAAAGVGGTLAAASLAVAGWARLVSPLTWQAERGLQVESVAATPAMVGWALAPERFEVGYGAYNAFEVEGPGTGALLTAAELAGPALLVALGVLLAPALRRPRGAWDPARAGEAVTWVALAAVTGFLVTSKVLSPQYLLWLLPMAAAGLAGAHSRDARFALLRWSAVLLLTAGLTQLVFPVLYGGLTAHQPSSLWVVVLLAVRNLLLVWLLAAAFAAASSAVTGAVGAARPGAAPRGSARQGA